MCVCVCVPTYLLLLHARLQRLALLRQQVDGMPPCENSLCDWFRPGQLLTDCAQLLQCSHHRGRGACEW